jgi:lipopolysaccharide transport system ATP-binding protein
LGKRYRIGARQYGYRTFREKLNDAALAPFRAVRSVFGRNGHPTSGFPGTKSANNIWALKDVSFEVKSGEVLGLIGRNGAGKSTLLKVLSRITEPTTGAVDIYGRVGSLLEVGTGFHPELTGRENVFLNGAILGMRKSEIVRKFDEIVTFAEIEKFIDTPVKHYSSGMYVRLAFAVAAHLEPEILLVDEVLAVGDAAFQKKCLGKMGDVAKAGRTVLFVSHNMAAVKSLCQRAIWLDEGQILESGETATVVDNYLQRGAFSMLERAWPDPAMAPGNEKVKIRSARVRSLSGDAHEKLTVHSPFAIDFEFWNFQPDAVLNFTMHLYNVEGAYVFATASKAQPRARGLVAETVTIPANLLNDGVYTVSVQVVQDTSRTIYLHSEVLAFEVLDAVREGAWFGKWPGVVRPRLEWNSTQVSDDLPLNG